MGLSGNSDVIVGESIHVSFHFFGSNDHGNFLVFSDEGNLFSGFFSVHGEVDNRIPFFLHGFDSVEEFFLIFDLECSSKLGGYRVHALSYLGVGVIREDDAFSAPRACHQGAVGGDSQVAVSSFG